MVCSPLGTAFRNPWCQRRRHEMLPTIQSSSSISFDDEITHKSFPSSVWRLASRVIIRFRSDILSPTIVGPRSCIRQGKSESCREKWDQVTDRADHHPLEMMKHRKRRERRRENRNKCHEVWLTIRTWVEISRYGILWCYEIGLSLERKGEKGLQWFHSWWTSGRRMMMTMNGRRSATNVNISLKQWLRHRLLLRILLDFR